MTVHEAIRRRPTKGGRNAKAQLDAFVAYAPIAIAMFDSEMRYIAVSERWLSDYQLTRWPVGLLHYDVFPEISEAWKGVHRRCLAGATESSEGEPFLRADGRVQWVKWSACP
jgi:PAS domain-containing protein